LIDDMIQNIGLLPTQITDLTRDFQYCTENKGTLPVPLTLAPISFADKRNREKKIAPRNSAFFLDDLSKIDSIRFAHLAADFNILFQRRSDITAPSIFLNHRKNSAWFRMGSGIFNCCPCKFLSTLFINTMLSIKDGVKPVIL